MYARRRLNRKRTSRPRRKISRRTAKRTSRQVVNTASLRECFTDPSPDGTVVFYRSLALDDANFDRSQAVAQAYQEFRIKYVKLTFRPSADTFAPAAGNTIPQLYFQIDKSSAIPTNANFQTFLDMGVRPIRFDAKNIVKIWKPTVLVTNSTGPGTQTATQIKERPWLSTNANAGNPVAVWAPNTTDHLGAVWFVTQMNPLTPPVNYVVDFETVFEFRKPLWRQGASSDGLTMPSKFM